MESWRKNYLTVWVALFTTSMGLMAFLPTLTVYVGERYGITDPIELTFWGSIVYGAAPLAAAVFGPLWGALGPPLRAGPASLIAEMRNCAVARCTIRR